MLDANNKAQFANQAFSLRNVELERRASDRALWIGSKFNAVPTLLILPAGNNSSIAAIGQGAWIDPTGRIYAAPRADQAKHQFERSGRSATGTAGRLHAGHGRSAGSAPIRNCA